MKLNRSKSWYEKKAKLESNCSISAGRFPSEILETKEDATVKTNKTFSVKAIPPAKNANAG
jgi:hypothetical protein